MYFFHAPEGAVLRNKIVIVILSKLSIVKLSRGSEEIKELLLPEVHPATRHLSAQAFCFQIPLMSLAVL